MTIACRACEVRVRPWMAWASPGTSACAASTSTWVRLRTSSPIACISWSSRSASTRTVEEPWLRELPSGRAAGVATTGVSGSPSTAASGTASTACASATSGTAAATSISSASVRSETSQATTSWPWKLSTSSGVGTQASVSPSEASAASTM